VRLFILRNLPRIKLLTVMAATGAGMYIMLRIVFAAHDTPPPPPLDQTAPLVLAILVCAVGLGIGVAANLKSIRKKSSTAAARKRAQVARAARIEQCNRLADIYAADPVRAKYAPLVRRGEDWSDANIAYQETPGITETCPHLQMIELAMRDGGIALRRFREGQVSAQCLIDPAALRRAFPVAPPIRYAEENFGRPGDDDLAAFLRCDEHGSVIYVLHRSDAKPDTLVFPSPETYSYYLQK